MKKSAIILTSATGCALATAFLITLTGCVAEVDATGPDVYAGPDNYVYYPGYEMYYGERSHQWYYHDGNRWVGRPQPRGVSVDVIHSAPSVHMAFHDNPGGHHTEVVKQYPHNWAPAGGGHEHDDREHH